MALSSLSRFRLFQTAVIAMFIFFVGLMFFVVMVAQARHSGRAAIDTAEMQEIRENHVESMQR